MSNYIRLSVDPVSYDFNMQMDPLRLGIIGAGRLGSFHAAKAHENPAVELYGVYDSLKESRSSLSQKFATRNFAELEALLDEVEAVVIATPTRNHHEIGMAALRRGKHVLMEKPLAYSAEEAKELLETAERNQVILQVGHVEQFNPAWRAVDGILDLLRQGQRAIITARRSSGYTFRSTDIGVVHDLMVHDLELILSAVSSELRSIQASGFHVIGSEQLGGHEDVAQAQLSFENGTVASVFASRVDHQPSRFMTIQTASHSAQIDFATRETKIYRADDAVLAGTFAPRNMTTVDPNLAAKDFMSERFHCESVCEEAVDALSLEMEDFVHSIRAFRAPRVSGRHGLRAVEAADAIVQEILRTPAIEKQRVKAA